MELKVLLVDDDELILAALKARCERAGFEVLTAVSSFQAISAIGEHRSINAICSDLNLKMPDGGGDNVLKYLQDINEHIPTIIMSTNPDAATAERLKQLGAIEVINKCQGNKDIVEALLKAGVNHFAKSRGARNVLLADDNDIQRTCLKLDLEALGYWVRTAHNADEVAYLLKGNENVFDVILTDLNMPAGGAGAVLWRLKAADNPIPVVVMSCDMPNDTRDELLRQGAVEAISKDNTTKIMMAVVNAAL